MRRRMIATGLALATAACGQPSDKATAEADRQALAAGFTPPSVTSRLDYGSSIQRRFARLDGNADGYIEPADWPKRGNLDFATFDTDHDGKVSGDEWGTTLLARFDRMDANRDGSLTSDERTAARAGLPEGDPAPADAPVATGLPQSAAPGTTTGVTPPPAPPRAR